MENPRKTFFYRKKIQLQYSKSGGIEENFFVRISRNFAYNYFGKTKINKFCRFVKNILSEKNTTSILKSGRFCFKLRNGNRRFVTTQIEVWEV